MSLTLDYVEHTGPVIRVGMISDVVLTGYDVEALIAAAEHETGHTDPIEVTTDGDRAVLTYEAHP